MSTFIGIPVKCEILENRFHFYIAEDEKGIKGKWVMTQPSSAYERLLFEAFKNKLSVQVSSSDQLGVTYACAAWNKSLLVD
jgi:hypothetical protein